MAYKKEIEILSKDIAQLNEIKEAIADLESRVMTIEKTVCAIDETIPSDAKIDAMAPGPEKEDILHALSLAKEAYDLIDEILGPPQQPGDAAMEDLAIMPQARGNDAISLEAALRKFNPGSFNPGGKNTAS